LTTESKLENAKARLRFGFLISTTERLMGDPFGHRGILPILAPLPSSDGVRGEETSAIKKPGKSPALQVDG
jgi:hypothetical protein